jgi:hypothetical protein
LEEAVFMLLLVATVTNKLQHGSTQKVSHIRHSIHKSQIVLGATTQPIFVKKRF